MLVDATQHATVCLDVLALAGELSVGELSNYYFQFTGRRKKKKKKKKECRVNFHFYKEKYFYRYENIHLFLFSPIYYYFFCIFLSNIQRLMAYLEGSHHTLRYLRRRICKTCMKVMTLSLIQPNANSQQTNRSIRFPNYYQCYCRTSMIPIIFCSKYLIGIRTFVENQRRICALS